MNADGSNPTQITHNKWNDGGPAQAPCVSIAWSPDGKRLHFHLCLDNAAIYVMNADGSNQPASRTYQE